MIKNVLISFLATMLLYQIGFWELQGIFRGLLLLVLVFILICGALIHIDILKEELFKGGSKDAKS